jgi:transposase
VYIIQNGGRSMLKNRPVPMPKTHKAIKPGTNGVRYVYHITNIYRKNGKPTYDCVCIGKEDPQTGLLIPNETYFKYYPQGERINKKIDTVNTVGATLVEPSQDKIDQDKTDEEASYKHYGNYLAFQHIADEISLTSILKNVFPDSYKLILMLAFYMTSEGNAMSNIESWQQTNYYDLEDVISDVDCSELFKSIKFSQRMKFFELWIDKHAPDGQICYDVTCIQSYSKKLNNVEWGYHGKHENLPQINLGMYYGQTSRLPVYYRAYQGSINDKSDLEYMVSHTKSLNLKKVLFVIDRGFYTDLNLQHITKNDFQFMIPLPSSRVIYSKLLNQNSSLIRSCENKICNYPVYGQSFIHKISGISANVHIFYDMEKAHNEDQDLYTKIEKIKLEIESLTNVDKIPKRLSKYYQIDIDNVNGEIKYNLNTNLINEKLKHHGFFIIITNDKSLKSSFVLDSYRRRDHIEKQFMTYKTLLDFKRLRTHNDETNEGKMFLQFISLILKASIINKLHDNRHHKSLKKISVEQLIEQLKMYSILNINNKSHKTTLSKLQKLIFNILGLSII